MGVVSRGQGDAGGVDWTSARGMFNGKLSKIEGALEKGIRLLTDALEIDPSPRRGTAVFRFSRNFTCRKPIARNNASSIASFSRHWTRPTAVHAAVQLALMNAREGDLNQAMIYLRWVRMARLDSYDERFFFVRFNIAMYYAHMEKKDRSLAEFRALLDRCPECAGEVADLFSKSPKLRGGPSTRYPGLLTNFSRPALNCFKANQSLGARTMNSLTRTDRSSVTSNSTRVLSLGAVSVLAFLSFFVQQAHAIGGPGTRAGVKSMGADISEFGADTDEGCGLSSARDRSRGRQRRSLDNPEELPGAHGGGSPQSSILITGTWEDARAVVIDSFGERLHLCGAPP